MESRDKEVQPTKMRVAVRVRAFNRREKEFGPENIIQMENSTVTITDVESPDRKQTQIAGFDHCLWSVDGFTINEEGQAVPDGQGSRFSGQEAVFQEIGLAAMEKAWEGYNIAMLAFGMTGTGKSYTMLGTDFDPGLAHRCTKHLFSQISSNAGQHKSKVTFSLFEIYNENVVDLLSKEGKGLQIRQRPNLGVYIENLTVMGVKSADQMEELVQLGLRNRSVAATRMNATSSRSHLILTIQFVQFMTGANGGRTKRRSRIRFIDLAGSERASKTGAAGQTLREAQSINKSVSGLHEIISALTTQKEGKKSFVPYRNSKLTRLLSEELGGNCLTTWIAAVGPAAYNYGETLLTLRLASRASKVIQKPQVNDLDVDAAIRSWKKAIDQLGADLASKETEDGKADIEQKIALHKLSIQKLESPWKESDSKDKGGIWWSSTVKLQQPELETMPYLQNISEDPQLSGVVKHVIPQGPVLLGQGDSENSTIQLSALGIQAEHAILMNTGSSLTIAPCSSKTAVHVNGIRISTTTMLNHLDHIKLGACELFILIGFPASRTSEKPKAHKHSHEKCIAELAEHHPLAQQLKPKDTSNVRAHTAAVMLFQEFMDLLPQVDQARAVAANFKKNMDFEVEICPDQAGTSKLFIRVTDKDQNMEWLWSKAKFEARKLAMDELNEQFLSDGKLPSLKNDNLFCEKANLDVCLGRCTISLHNTAYHTPIDDNIPVLDLNNKPVGTVHVSIMASDNKGEPLQTRAPTLQDPRQLSGQSMYLTCAVTSFSGVLWVAGNPQLRGVYCKLLVEGETQPYSTEVVHGVVSGTFTKTFLFSFDTVNQNILDFLLTRGLQLELWGAQRSSSNDKQPSPQPATTDEQLSSPATNNKQLSPSATETTQLPRPSPVPETSSTENQSSEATGSELTSPQQLSPSAVSAIGRLSSRSKSQACLLS